MPSRRFLNKCEIFTGQEILRIRSEAHGELRRREEELTRKFQTQQDRFEADFIRQKQSMVNDFNRATDALKDKLSALSIAYVLFDQ